MRLDSIPPWPGAVQPANSKKFGDERREKPPRPTPDNGVGSPGHQTPAIDPREDPPDHPPRGIDIKV